MILSFTTYTFVYFVLTFYLEEMPGNTYFVGLAFGVAEFISIFLYGYLVTQFGDMILFSFSYAILVGGFLALLFGPKSFAIVALLSMICALGGWILLHFLITELRVPPQNLGSVNVMSQCVGQIGSLAAPFVVTFKGDVPFYLCIGMATLVILMANMLPNPGYHLPAVVEVENNKDEGTSERRPKITNSHKNNDAAGGRDGDRSNYSRYNSRDLSQSRFVFDETLNQDSVLIETMEA